MVGLEKLAAVEVVSGIFKNLNHEDIPKERTLYCATRPGLRELLISSHLAQDCEYISGPLTGYIQVTKPWTQDSIRLVLPKPNS